MLKKGKIKERLHGKSLLILTTYKQPAFSAKKYPFTGLSPVRHPLPTFRRFYC